MGAESSFLLKPVLSLDEMQRVACMEKAMTNRESIEYDWQWRLLEGAAGNN